MTGKKIYTDITNILEIQSFTGIPRVLTEVTTRMIKAGADICLLSFSKKYNSYIVVDSQKFVSHITTGRPYAEECYTDITVTIDDICSDSVFLDINSCWHTIPQRSWLLPRLKNKNVEIIVLIYDLIPITHPQFLIDQTRMKFMHYIIAHMRYADKIITNSIAVADDVYTLYRELDMNPKPVTVIPLGADFTHKVHHSIGRVSRTAKNIVSNGKYILTVGTIEPRKNHSVIFDAYNEYLEDEDIQLVFAGHIGWNVDKLINNFKTHPHYGKKLHIIDNANDATISYLYENAFAVVFASYTEGFGLPTIEALIHKVPVIVSDIPVMHETGGDFCSFFDPDNAEELASIIKGYLDDPQLYAQQKKYIEEYRIPEWEVTTKKIIELIDLQTEDKFTHSPVKQIVYLSARPEPLLDTLPFIERFMKFITEMVVCCPDNMAEFLKTNYTGRLKLTVITDSMLLAGHELPEDHSTRNFFLRCLAIQRDEIDNEFIMSDDDYRPLTDITEEVFFSGGRYNAFYFMDIDNWKHTVTDLFSYDYCHFKTLDFLKCNGYPTLQYSAHQPQIINKKWYRQMISVHPDITTKGYDEWSTYFNFCAVRHKQYFRQVPYVTLGWPNVGTCWKYSVRNKEYLFENFYESNYDKGRIFYGFSTKYSENIEEQNKLKTDIAFRIQSDCEAGFNIYDDFASSHASQYRQIPSVSIYCPDTVNDAVTITAPEFYTMKSDVLNRVRFRIARDKYSLCNKHTMKITAEIHDKDGRSLCSSHVKATPVQTETGCHLRAHVAGNQFTLRIICQIEKTGYRTQVDIPLNVL
ncbi:MAG: glycosyltransferase family 1 protein [Oscillospiraceae bacterium]|nr:glycosyltransferase family 1 protein [Oscillospiraceae bacterium]